MIDLREHVPPIRRARGYRLYDLRGRRLLDLYQNGGAAITGHRGGEITAELKAVAARGLLFDMPSVYEGRLLKKLADAYPGFRDIRLCVSLEAALSRASAALGETIRPHDVADPVMADPAPGEPAAVCLDRPFLPAAARGCLRTARAVIPVLPFQLGGAPAVLCLRDPSGAHPAAAAPPLSPLLLACLLRAMHDLDRFQPPPWFDGGLVGARGAWVQIGPYLRPTFDRDDYAREFHRCLERGVLLNPDPNAPSILPGEASAGELDKISKLLNNDRGG